MSSKPETTFYKSVLRHLPPPTELHREKMANPYRGGTADTWFSGKRDLWVEWKFLKLPKRDDTPIRLGLTALQLDWLGSRCKEGRNVVVIAGCIAGGVVFKNCRWEEPVSTGLFRTAIKSRQELAAWILAVTQGGL